MGAYSVGSNMGHAEFWWNEEIQRAGRIQSEVTDRDKQVLQFQANVFSCQEHLSHAFTLCIVSMLMAGLRLAAGTKALQSNTLNRHVM